MSTQLEYDTADYAIASLAKDTGDTADYTKFATLAQSWQNTFNAGTGYMQAKLSSGQWRAGFTPGTSDGFVEGTSAQYTPMVPFNLRALINARGGNAAWVSYLNSLTANLTNPSGTNADLSNEPSLEIPYEYDYVGTPYLTQQTVRSIEDKLYFDAPVGQDGNDDLGAMSSAYVWDELGFYPETPGTPTWPWAARCSRRRSCSWAAGAPHDQRAGRPACGALHPEHDRQRHGVEQGLPGLRHAVVGHDAGLHAVQHAQQVMGQQHQCRAALGPDR